jgi:hypothetical protein
LRWKNIYFQTGKKTERVPIGVRGKKEKVIKELCSLFARLISHQPAVLFSQNKPATSNQPSVLFSQNKPAPATSHQPTEHAVDL